MSPEDVQRTVQFLLNQQAQFAADLTASQARFESRIEALSAKTDRVADGLIGLTTIVGHVVDSVSKIAEAQKRTTEQVQRIAEQVERTDSHLDVVIQMFERHLREDHGHRPS